MNKENLIDKLIEGRELLRQFRNLEIYEQTPGADLNSQDYLKSKERLYNQIKIYGGVN